MSGWADVVTTGLIGTDRRPMPDDLRASWAADFDQERDPAHAVLALAARHRVASRAGNPLRSCPPAPVAPPSQAPLASLAAHKILTRLLSPPHVDLLNLWLAGAVGAGQRAAATYWTPLTMVAARGVELDRAALGTAVGERGIWFLEQNPQWARLAQAVRSAQPYDPSAHQEVAAIDVAAEAVRADPELIMRAGTRWSKEVSSTVLDIICSGQLQQRSVRYAAAVGVRLPLEHYDLLRSALSTPAGLRSVREALLSLERTVWVRMEMQSAFTGEPIRVDRLELPQW
jgi:hypothetical protein